MFNIWMKSTIFKKILIMAIVILLVIIMFTVISCKRYKVKTKLNIDSDQLVSEEQESVPEPDTTQDESNEESQVGKEDLKMEPCTEFFGQIVFGSDRAIKESGNKYEIYYMDQDGKNLTQLTNNDIYDNEPTWSPDHCKIAFKSFNGEDGYDDIYVINIDGSGLTRLTTNSGFDGMPSWSPDGTKIAYISEQNGKRDLFIMNTDGTEQINLTNSPEQERDPEWSPDGKMILFECTNPVGDEKTEGHSGICLINPDGTDFTRLTPISDRNYMFPTWSPDGKKVAIVTNLTHQLEIYLMDMLSGKYELKQISNFYPNVYSDPRFLNWSSDGEYLLMENIGENGSMEIYKYYIAEEKYKLFNLTNLESNDEFPDW